MAMTWETLMSCDRITAESPSSRRAGATGARSPFEKDWDKIVFSKAFRRLHDKTQVFPFPAAHDFVHSRLAHSLEVACVGRTLGTIVGGHVCKGKLRKVFSPSDVGAVVASACLAHDMGNAPLGHEGENAIRDFFASQTIDFMDRRELLDLRSFDGNPQGFRLLTRLLNEKDGGLRLTAATLAAFSKYPWASTESDKALPKFGFFKSESKVFGRVAKATGLINAGPERWCRHPLAFVVEAADDICYSILDVEDGNRLGHVHDRDARRLFAQTAQIVARKAGEFSIERLRGLAIRQLVREVSQTFKQNELAIMKGSYADSLTKKHAALKALKDCARQQYYRAAEVLELEMAGREAIRGLLTHFVGAVSSLDTPDSTAFKLLQARKVQLEESGSPYQRVLRVTDYISGMTDGSALETYRRLTGIDLSRRAA